MAWPLRELKVEARWDAGRPQNEPRNFAEKNGGNTQTADFFQKTFSVTILIVAKASVTGAQSSPLPEKSGTQSCQTPLWSPYKCRNDCEASMVRSDGGKTDQEDHPLLRDIEDKPLKFILFSHNKTV